jgi:cation diffusion facilitator CzcD-associated flavoprotein CzcO
MNGATDVEVLIVGAGISGVGVAIELLRRGLCSFALLEAASDLGGTWRDNTYPGIAVDIPSASYCFSFETDYPWSRKFAAGAEIQDYVRHCAVKYGVSGHIRYRSRVARCQFDPARDAWSSELEDGTLVTSRYLVAATGLFGAPKLPTIPGLETFTGKVMHTARWDHHHDLRLQRVAVIGTGASAVQLVPEIAPLVAQLTVFQRTPIWIGPRLDRTLSSSRWSPRRFSVVRTLLRLVSESNLQFLTLSIVNYRRSPFVVRWAQRCLRLFMRQQVRDRETADQLLPRYGLGCKRPTTSNSYLPAFNRDNVRLVTQPIERICPTGIVTNDATVHEIDTVVLATGFLTTEQGNAPAFEVIGRDGIELGQFWHEHRRQAYAGVSVPGFPNFFLTGGPYSGGFNWFTMLETQVHHIAECIDGAGRRGATRVEVRREAHARYMHHMWGRAEGTVFKDRSCLAANSYYVDAHGDASLPLPHTPWWRVMRERRHGTRDYEFGPPNQRQGQPVTPEERA